MAIEIFPDSPSMGMSPRISFSQDISQTDGVPVEQYIRSSSSSIDFDFCVFRGSFDQESSADELFFGGKILPIEIKKRLPPPIMADYNPPPPPRAAAFPPPQPPPPVHTTPNNTTTHETEEKNQNYKPSFWGFKRSASLNCGSGYARTLCPLPLLSRSNSTGSTSKRASLSNNPKQGILKNSLKQSQIRASFSTFHNRPPLKKNYNNGMKINPVLNVPRTNLFGFGSIFSGGKDKIKKKC